MTSGEAAFKVVVAKLAYQLNFSVEVAYGNGWHLHTVEPVLLDHGVPGGIDERQPITGLELPIKAELAEDIARQAGLATDHVFMRAVTGFHASLLPVDQQIQHVGFDGTVDNRQLLAVVQGVEHRDLKGGAVGDGRFTRLQIDLHAIALGEGLEAGTEAIQRIAFAGEVDTATQAHPLHALEQRAEALLDLLQHAVEQVEITVLAVVVDHETGDQGHHLFNLVGIPLAEAAEGACRVGNQPVGTADLGIETQAAHMVGRGVGKALQLTDGVEDDLVRVGQHLFNLVVGIGDAVGMGFPAELALAQLDLVQGGRGGAVHVPVHQVEYRPGGEALESQQRPGPGVFAQVGDLLHIAQQLALVDQVIRRLDHGDGPSISPAPGPGITQTRDYRAKGECIGGILTSGAGVWSATDCGTARAMPGLGGGSEIVAQADGGQVNVSFDITSRIEIAIFDIVVALILQSHFKLGSDYKSCPNRIGGNPIFF